MLNSILSWIAEEIKKLRLSNQPTRLERPLLSNYTQLNWKYVAPKSGMLYLAFVSIQRSYVGIRWNNADIGDFAMPTGSSAGATVIPVVVKKGDEISIYGLNENCYLSHRSCLLVWGGRVS